MKPTFTEQLQDPRWQKKRLEVLERDKWTCQQCDSKTKTLHVHHRYYVSHRFLWEYPDFCFQTLCKKCHDNVRVTFEERREEGVAMFEDWEYGLNFFGDDIFDMATEEHQSMEEAKTS